MAKTEVINTRAEPKIKRAFTRVLKPLGLTATDAISLFIHQVVLEKGLPFPVRIPNKETQKAMRNVLKGKGTKRHESFEDLMRDTR